MLPINKNVIVGVLLTLSGSLLYVLMGILAKNITQQLSIDYLMFLQSMAGLVCASYLAKIKKYSWSTLFIQHNAIHFWRTIMSLGSVYTLMYGLQYVSLFNALVILNTAPLIIPLLRKLLFNTSINIYLFPAIFLAFTGLLMILKPNEHIVALPILIVVSSMIFMSLSLLILEKNQAIDPLLSLFYYFLYSSLITGCLLIFRHQLTIAPIPLVTLGVMIGCLFFFVQVSVIYASQYVSSQLISLLFYAEIIFALIASVILESLKLNNTLLLGTIMIILGGAAVILLESNHKLL